jgi:Uncharacterized conserved protein (DUF2190)
MAYDEAIRSVTLTADSSLAGYTGAPGTPGAADPNYGLAQYRFVKITGAKQCGLSTAGADLSVGVCQNKPQVAGQAATVAIRGISLILAGGAFDPGDELESDSNGRAVVATTGKVLGIAVEAAGGADQLSSVLLRCN